MTRRLPKKGDLVMTADFVSGYYDREDTPIYNQLAIVTDAREIADGGQAVKVRLLATNMKLVLFEYEYSYPGEQDETESA